MRKASHDGGDSTSVTSGFENEKKKPKKTSIKRKTPSFSQASDDTANEPLLQKDKEKPEAQSAKYFGIGKADRDIDNKVKPSTATTGFCGTTESLLSFKDTENTKTTSTAPLHNYMNTNVFNTHENAKTNVTTKSQILVEIDSSKQSGYSPSPLIFTTAKIHTDAKTKQMEPVHVTPVPILSTIEVSVSKGGTITTNEKKIGNGSSVISPVYTPIPLNKNKEEKVSTNNFNTILSPTSSKDVFAKTIPVTSATKVTPNTIVLSSFTPSALSSSNAKSTPVTSNLQGTKDSKNNQMLPQYIPPEPKSSNLDSTRTNSTVKTIITSVPKGTSNLTASIKANQSNKTEKESNQNTSNIKSPTYTESSKSVYNTIASKQLQRQKTATEEISDTATTVKPKEELKDASAKIPTTYSKSDSISIKDNVNTLSKTSANDNNASIKPSSNTTSKSISNMSTTSTTTKPIVTSGTVSNNVGLNSIGKNAMENSKNTVSSVNSNSSNGEKSVSVTLPKTTSTATVTKSTTSIVKPPDIAAIKNSTVLSLQKSTPVNKTMPEQNTASASDTTISLASTSSVKSKSAVTTKESAMTTTLSSQSMSNPTNKTTVTKAPSVTTSAKTSNATKLSQSTPQTSSTTPLVAVKVPVTMHIDVLGIVVTSPDTSTSQSVTSAPAITSKQATSALAGSITTKPAITTSSVTPSTVSSKSAAVTVDIKSPNNNTSQTIVTAKPTNSIPKTESVTSSKPSSSTTSSTSTVKSPQVTSASVSTKETTKKPALMKTQPMTKSQPVTATNKTVASSTKTPSSETATTPAAKKSSVTAKTSTVTSAVKSPSSSVTKASAVTSTSSASASKSTTTSVSQVSANKPVGVVGSSVPSTTPGLRPSESIKKSGSKSSENTKDVKNSKA